MDIKEFLRRLEAGEPILTTKEDGDALMQVLKSLMSGKAPDDTSLTAEQLMGKLTPALNNALNTPEGREFANQAIRDRQTERFVKKNKPFFTALLAGADVATSLSQIRESNKAIKNLVRPAVPNANVLDPALNAAIADAQKGTLDTLRALEPAKQEIALQRLNDINQAKLVSGGQSGAYGSLATGASLRAMRAANNLPQIQDTIRARQQQRSDNLIGVRQGVLQNEFNNRLSIADRNLQQYINDSRNASALGQAGRVNLRNTLGQLPDVFTRAVGQAMPVSQMSQPRTSTTVLGNQLWSDYKAKLDADIAARINQSRVRPMLNNLRPVNLNYKQRFA